MKMPPPIATKFTKLVLTILAITILGIILSFISQDHTLLMLSAGVAVAGGVKIIDYYRTIKGEHYECIEGTLVREQAGYDRYFKKALADTCAASQVFSAKSIRTLGNLYLDHEDEFEKLRKHCGSRIEYPAAKILDMCFFEYGFQRNASSQEDSD